MAIFFRTEWVKNRLVYERTVRESLRF